jgi:hypothetical protein
MNVASAAKFPLPMLLGAARKRFRIQEIDGRILFLSLKPTHIGTINASVEGELLLRQPTVHPDLTQIPRDQSPKLDPKSLSNQVPVNGDS